MLEARVTQQKLKSMCLPVLHTVRFDLAGMLGKSGAACARTPLLTGFQCMLAPARAGSM